MSKYRMNVLFKDTDLDVIKKGSLKVVLVKHTEEQSNSVAWVTFNPFEINTIDWEELFAIYASASEAQSGATINKISESMGQCQVNSIFDSGYFSSAKPDGTIGVNSYEITNDYQVNDGLTFGLAQSVIVNGTAFDNHPINAIWVPKSCNAVMTPIERIDIFLHADIDNSTVISTITSKILTVTYEGDEAEHTLNYNVGTASFYISK